MPSVRLTALDATRELAPEGTGGTSSTVLLNLSTSSFSDDCLDLACAERADSGLREP